MIHWEKPGCADRAETSSRSISLLPSSVGRLKGSGSGAVGGGEGDVDVAHADARLKEASKLGFTGAIMPKRRGKAVAAKGRRSDGLEIVEIDHLHDLLALFPPRAEGRAAKSRVAARHG